MQFLWWAYSKFRVIWIEVYQVTMNLDAQEINASSKRTSTALSCQHVLLEICMSWIKYDK